MTNEFLKNEMVTANNETLKQKFFSTNGRIDRMTFFKRTLALIGVEFLLTFIVGFAVIMMTLNSPNSESIMSAVITMIALAALFPEYCLNVKRLHDIGRDETLAKIFVGVGILGLATGFLELSTPMAISVVISIISVGFMFYLLFKRGEDKANEYGEAQ